MFLNLRARRVLAVLALAAFFSAANATAQHLRVYYPDIEQGSATLVVSPTGKALLIDAGTGIKSVDEGIENFINDLIDAGVITSLDYTLATHYDEDHIGRMENVFQLVPFAPGAIAYDRGEFGGVPSTFAYGDYSFGASFFNRTTVPICTTLDLGGGATAKVYAVNGETCGGATVTIIGAAQFENNASVAVLVEYGDVDVWIGGDLTGNPDKGVADVESVVAPLVGDVDVYTINHHGSETSSNSTFLSALEAEVAVNQSSIENNFGHPRATIINAILATPDTDGNTPLIVQQNPGDSTDTRSDDSLADHIVDCDDSAAGEVIGLPGTIVLISDGTSYQMHGCTLPRIAKSADAGLGTIGDYPPAIRRVLQTPRVPLATEGVSVEADIEDNGTISAEIRYELDGVVQSPIAMTLSSGITWTGTIPAQTDGTQVRFRVAATDNLSQTELSAAAGYYSGTTNVATIRVNDADEVLVPKTYGVRVEGNLTVEPGIFHEFVTQAYVQDATAGVQIFDAGILPLSRGDLVEFVGEIEQFGGQTEVNIAENFGNFGYSLISSGTAPAPLVVTVAQVGESTEGELIRINGLSVWSGTIPETGSGNLTVTDDGGTSLLTLRVDDTTDIPGSNTPTQPFDLIGVSSQFDSWVPLDSGYQIVPREKNDFLTEEVNFGAVVISEIHADPASGTAGDANGDGTRSATNDEFVELLNPGSSAVDISNWTISDAGGVKFTFPSSTTLPAREATVVFGGGTPTGDFGNAAANGLVFTASGLSLNNSGDTVTLKDGGGVIVQTVTYGSEASSDESIVRDPDFSNAPFVRHTTAQDAGGRLFSPGTRINGEPFSVRQGDIILTEVMYDPSGADGGLEWFELYNTTTRTIEINDLCVGSGGGAYTKSVVPLDGCTGGCSIGPGDTFVVGGPDSTADNANPTFDLVFEFSPGFQNSGSTADGVALFNLRCAQVNATTVPIDAVVYGGSNVDGLIDETGVANAPEVGDVSGGHSIARVDLAGAWTDEASPNPNFFSPGGSPPPPPPGGGAADLILTEVFYDVSGSDNGFEWVEICNNDSVAVDLSAYSLGWGGTSWDANTEQLSGTIQPGEVYVIGGPSTDSTNGNPVYDLVLNLSADLQNSGSPGDGVALFNLLEGDIGGTSVPIDAVVYGSDNNSGLVDETGVANAPEVGDAPAGSSIERTDVAGAWQIQSSPDPNNFSGCSGSSPPPPPPPPPPSGNVILSEVVYDVSSGDNGFEWIELYNAGTASVDLSGYTIGYGGTTYDDFEGLSGTIAAGATFVIGGPTSSSTNGNPTYDLVLNFSPDLQNSGTTADGIALYDLAVASVTSSTVPKDAVIYGGSNTNNLIDESGSANAPDVGDAPAGQSIERTSVAGAWQIQSSPTPGSSPL